MTSPVPLPQLLLPEQVGCWDLVQMLRQVQTAWSQKWSGWKRRVLKDNIGAFELRVSVTSLN